MTRPVRVAPAAERELAAAYEWYESQRPGLGRELVAAIDIALAAIAADPEAWAPWPPRPRFRHFVVARFPYVVFFRVVVDEVSIEAFAHAKRRPGYWARR